MRKKELKKIDKKAFKQALKKAGITQKELCDEICVDYGNFNKKIQREELSQVEIMALSQILDVSPFVITGEEDFGNDAVSNDYSMYERSLVDSKKLLKDLLLESGFSNEQIKSLDKKEKWALIFLLQDVCKVYMSQRKKASDKDKQLTEALKKFKEEISSRIEFVNNLTNHMRDLK